MKVARYQDAKTITFTNVKTGRIIWGIHAYNRDYYDGKVSGKKVWGMELSSKVVVKRNSHREGED